MLVCVEAGRHIVGGLIKGLIAIASCSAESASGECSERLADCIGGILLVVCKTRGLYVNILFSQYLCKNINIAKMGIHPSIPGSVVTDRVRSDVIGGSNVGI